MSNREGILEDADSLLEHNRFAEARDAYRKALAAGYISRKALGNLSIAENEERLAFFRTLVSLFPDDIECRLAEASEMIAVGRAAHAVHLCTVLLEERTAPKDQVLARLLRLRAAARCGRFQGFVEDFRGVWHAEAVVHGAQRFRAGLLEVVSAITDVKAIPVLETLARETLGADAIARFLTAKVTELHTLENAKADSQSEDG